MGLKKWILALAAMAVLCILAIVAAFLWLRSSGRPARTGSHVVAALAGEVLVRWDGRGIPHVEAGNERDLAVALGYLHANDRMTQMELGRLAATGRLAELLGEAAVEIDVYFRTLRTDLALEAMERSASEATRLWLAGYADGVNAWLTERSGDLPPGLRVLGAEPEPWRPQDSLAFALLMARDLSFWNERPEEIRFAWLRAFGPEKVRELLGDPELFIDPEILALAGHAPVEEGVVVDEWDVSGDVSGGSGEEREAGPASSVLAGIEPHPTAPGSNSWAIGGGRAAAGEALLSNDPHLGLFLPSVWYQVQLRAPGYEAAGMTLPGAPGVVLGRGREVAWAFTNVMLDDHDLFFERLDERGERYQRGEEWLPVELTEQTIRIRGGDSRELVLRSTDRGPLLAADAARHLPARSLAWTAHLGGDPFGALRAMARAASVDELLSGIEGFVCPAQNLVAAFENGELLYTVLGRIPDRHLGGGRLPVPGWRTEHGWDGLRPRSSHPVTHAPEDSLLVTANSSRHLEAHSPSFSGDYYVGHRHDRIAERLMEHGGWTVEDVAELQVDSKSLYARDLIETLGDGYEGDAGRARAALGEWDRRMSLRGPSALYALFERELMMRIFADEQSEEGLWQLVDRATLWRLMRGQMSESWFDDVSTPRVEGRRQVVAEALAWAWGEGSERWGEEIGEWDYGTLHGLTLKHRLDALPVLGVWMRRGPYAAPGSATSVNALAGAGWVGGENPAVQGPSMRFVVDWSQPDQAFSVLPGGQSGHPADPHYSDEIEPFMRGELLPFPWSSEAIERLKVSEMRLVP